MPISASHLARVPGTALHQQLFMVLKDQIVRGVYPVGKALPNEQDLGHLFGVSRITVRHALKDLHAEGYVDRRRGSGTYIKQNRLRLRPPANLRYLDSMRLMNRETEVKVLHVETSHPSTEVISQLQLELNAHAVYTMRLRSLDGLPMMLIEAWSPSEVSEFVSAAALRKSPLYELLARGGVKPKRVVQEISAVAADPPTANYLACEVSSPLLRITRLLYNAELRPVQYKIVHVTSARTRLLHDFGDESMDNLMSGGHFLHTRP